MFDNLFDQAMAQADRVIFETLGTTATINGQPDIPVIVETVPHQWNEVVTTITELHIQPAAVPFRIRKGHSVQVRVDGVDLTTTVANAPTLRSGLLIVELNA
jgi:hypothetical protein